MILALLLSTLTGAVLRSASSAHALSPLILPRAGWTATASSSAPGEAPSNMLDGNTSTRWSSGTAMAPGQSVTVDMGAARVVSGINLTTGPSTGDTARGIQVFLSKDGSSWGAAVATGGADVSAISFPVATVRYVKLVQTGSAGNWWSIAEFNASSDGPDTSGSTALSRTGWTVSASSSAPGEAPSNMLDGNVATRWSTGVAMSAGQSITVDMGAARSVNEIRLDSAGSSGDFGRGHQVSVSTDGSTWTAVASGPGNTQLVSLVFPETTARYINVVQTASASNWWSIAEFNAYGTGGSTPPTTPPVTQDPSTPPAGTPYSRTGWSASASASAPSEGPANMLDGNASTRWSSGVAMSSGLSVTIDTGANRTIGRIVMDSAASSGDFARAYQVFLSTDGISWGSAVASGAGSAPLIDVSFAAASARYIKVVQTGSAAAWWSIAEFNAFASGSVVTTPVVTPPVSGWVGGWGAGLANFGNGIRNQTVRMVVHNTVPGSSVRIRLSNQFGNNPLPIGAVSIAVQSNAGNAVPGTRHVVTFGGSATTTVAAHADIASDAVAMNVNAEQNLLVSIYFPGDAGTSSWHWAARETTYYSKAGDFAADDSAGNYPASDSAWYYLNGLDVQSSTAKSTVVAFGDSITDGSDSTPSANNRWPNYLARRIQSQSNGPALGVVNVGIGGNRLITDTFSQFGQAATARFAHDALTVPGVKEVILLEGINDICTNVNTSGGSLTSQDMINGYQNLIAQAHAANVKIFGATIIPAWGAGCLTSGGESIRQAVNTWIRTSGAFDGVFDMAAATGAPGDPNRLNPAYDAGDHLHPNDAGMQAMANSIDINKL